MKKFLPTLALAILMTTSTVCGQNESTPSNPMTPEHLKKLLKEFGTDIQINQNVIQFRVADVQLLCIYDTNYNRMRIIAPIIETAKITSEQKDKMMEANFHSALDARYGTDNGVLYAAFIHPLSFLEDIEVESAIRQVATLALTFGSSYSSGELQFGDPADEI